MKCSALFFFSNAHVREGDPRRREGPSARQTGCDRGQAATQRTENSHRARRRNQLKRLLLPLKAQIHGLPQEEVSYQPTERRLPLPCPVSNVLQNCSWNVDVS